MKFEDLPKKIAIFPLSSAIFFPGTILPLNIFEERYLHLVNDSIKNQRIFGMVQPKRNKKTEKKKIYEPKLYSIGCLGKIINFFETEDNRLIITLLGLCRFKIIDTISNNKLYKEFTVDYSGFENDLNASKVPQKKIDTDSLITKLKVYFKKKNYFLDWNILKKLDQEQLIDTICMISPLSVEEKQKLLETKKIDDKLYALNEILNFNLHTKSETQTVH